MAEEKKEEAKTAPAFEQAGMREITIQLDTYDDIFSDFDPRPYSQRALSEDFLKEAQRRYLENRRGRFEVHFTIPSSGRDLKEEALIKKRLREHFAIAARREGDLIQSTRKRGLWYMLIGALVLLANVYTFFLFNEESLVYQLLTVILVPAGWYGMFTGIGKVVDEPYDAAIRKGICEKFERANYVFMSDERE